MNLSKLEVIFYYLLFIFNQDKLKISILTFKKNKRSSIFKYENIFKTQDKFNYLVSSAYIIPFCNFKNYIGQFISFCGQIACPLWRLVEAPLL